MKEALVALQENEIRRKWVCEIGIEFSNCVMRMRVDPPAGHLAVPDHVARGLCTCIREPNTVPGAAPRSAASSSGFMLWLLRTVGCVAGQHGGGSHSAATAAATTGDVTWQCLVTETASAS